MAPTDIAVTGRGLPGGRAEAKQRDELIIGIDQVAQLSPWQGLVAKVAVAFDYSLNHKDVVNVDIAGAHIDP